MGNDARSVDIEDIPFRFIEIPVGSAPPPPPPSSPIRKSLTSIKCNAPPIPPRRFDGYDAPPSLLPPPIVPKRFDQPKRPQPPMIPPRSDLRPSSSKQTIHLQNSPRKISCHPRKIFQRKTNCCILS